MRMFDKKRPSNKISLIYYSKNFRDRLLNKTMAEYELIYFLHTFQENITYKTVE